MKTVIEEMEAIVCNVLQGPLEEREFLAYVNLNKDLKKVKEAALTHPILLNEEKFSALKAFDKLFIPWGVSPDINQKIKVLAYMDELIACAYILNTMSKKTHEMLMFLLNEQDEYVFSDVVKIFRHIRRFFIEHGAPELERCRRDMVRRAISTITMTPLKD